MSEPKPNFPEPRIENHPGMLLAGIRRHHTMADAPKTIPPQWEEFRNSGILMTRAPRSYGVICGGDGEGFEYMTAVEVETYSDAPDFGRLKVPPQKYAVFATDAHVSAVGPLWNYIWTKWLPNSEYEDGETPSFELYDKRYEVETGNGGFEIWFPVK